jgi:hypothetical protein
LIKLKEIRGVFELLLNRYQSLGNILEVLQTVEIMKWIAIVGLSALASVIFIIIGIYG